MPQPDEEDRAWWPFFLYGESRQVRSSFCDSQYLV
jgi:hypothetical protein